MHEEKSTDILVFLPPQLPRSSWTIECVSASRLRPEWAAVEHLVIRIGRSSGTSACSEPADIPDAGHSTAAAATATATANATRLRYREQFRL